jgi:5-methylcytosine-specific restriction endonuclease McrA
VDHIIPIVDAPELRLDLENLQSLCKKHHHAKGLLDGSNRWGKTPNK